MSNSAGAERLDPPRRVEVKPALHEKYREGGDIEEAATDWREAWGLRGGVIRRRGR